jgi:hypothetical protein
MKKITFTETVKKINIIYISKIGFQMFFYRTLKQYQRVILIRQKHNTERSLMKL